MARQGLKSLLVLALCAALSVFQALAAGSEPSKPKPQNKKGEVNAMFFGEGGDQTDPPTPDQIDYQQTSSMQHGDKPPAPPTLPSVDTPSPTLAPISQTESAAPATAKPQTAQPEAAKPPASNGPSTFPYVPGPQSAAAPKPAAVWPGPKRPSGSAAAKPADPGPQVTVAGEKLRDAPAPANPKMYSLWAGLSTPLLLPSGNVKSLSADKAKDLGRADYESRILGDRAVPQAGGAVADVGAPAGAAQAGAAPSALSGSEKGVYVVLELDVAKTPGDFKASLDRVASAGELRVDERFPPSFMDPARTRVLVHGWLPVERFAQVMTSEGVSRVEMERSSMPPPPDTGSTELLLGLRIPPDSRPNIAMRDAVLRLAANARFELQGMVGYQAIPGSNEIVMIVSGRAPVREMGRIMADPSVVKVAPRPNDDRSASADPKPRTRLERMLRHPAFLLVLILLTAALLNPVFSRRG